jgi:XTP/dITP diphosphohydrolase
MRLFVASKNLGKIREIKKICRSEIEILSPLDIRDNSLKKALVYFRKTNICTIGEDSGLFVEALFGKPGVYSARYAGGDDASNREKLLTELKGRKNREAYFKTVITLVVNEHWIEFFEGEVRGKITEEELGGNGFGYDAIFLPDGYGKTFGEMEEKEKNSISHRRIALEKLFDYIEEKKEKIKNFCE